MGRGLSALLVLLAALFWGTTGTAQAFAPEGAHPVAIGALRLAVGGASLLCYVLWRGLWPKKDGWPLGTTLLAAFSIALYQPLFFSGVAMTGVAVGTVVTIGSSPILAGLLQLIFQRKKPGSRWWWATLSAVVGCGLLLRPGEGADVNFWGLLLALGAGLSFAAYTLFSKTLVEKNRPELVAAVVLSLSALILSPILFFGDLSWLAEGRGLVVVLHLGLVATALAYLLFVHGLLGLSAPHAVTLSLAEPLTAALLGVFLVGEELTSPAVAGLLLLFLGLALLTVPSRSAEK